MKKLKQAIGIVVYILYIAIICTIIEALIFLLVNSFLADNNKIQIYFRTILIVNYLTIGLMTIWFAYSGKIITDEN